jgi:hypothetical protein
VPRTTKRRGAALLAATSLLAVTAMSLPSPSQAHDARAEDGFFAGRLLTQAGDKPIKGATVRVFRINTDTLLGSAKSGPEGRFRIEGLSADDEELDVPVVGRAVHFESGWVACNHKVVQSWGEACSYGQGRQTAFFLQHL